MSQIIDNFRKNSSYKPESGTWYNDFREARSALKQYVKNGNALSKEESDIVFGILKERGANQSPKGYCSTWVLLSSKEFWKELHDADRGTEVLTELASNWFDHLFKGGSIEELPKGEQILEVGKEEFDRLLALGKKGELSDEECKKLDLQGLTIPAYREIYRKEKLTVELPGWKKAEGVCCIIL